LAEDFDFLLWLLLNHTRYVIDRTRQKELNQYGISARVAGVLFTIVQSGNSIRQAELIRRLNMEPQSISELLSRMAKQGLIVRVKDLEKKNLVRVEITEKGLEIYGMSTNRKSITGVMSAITQKEKEQLWAILLKLRESTLDQLQQDNSYVYPPSNPKEV